MVGRIWGAWVVRAIVLGLAAAGNLVLAVLGGRSFRLLGMAGLGAAVAIAVVWLAVWWLNRGRAASRAGPPATPAPTPPRWNAWSALGRLLGPLKSIGRALRPLALPLIVVVLFATRDEPLALQFLVGAGLAGLIWLFARGEGEFEHERSQLLALRRSKQPGLTGVARAKSFARSAVPWILNVAFGGVVFGYLGGFAGQIGDWTSLAGPSGVPELIALLLLSIALPFRLFGWATNWYRRGAAIALALLIAQVLLVAGVFRFGDAIRSAHLDFGWSSLVLVGVLVGLLVAEGVVVAEPAAPEVPFQVARAWGLLLACLSTLALFAALVIATLDTIGGADKLPDVRTALAPRILDTYGGLDTDVAWTFAPVLHLEHDEQWGPTDVNSFLAQAKESGAEPAQGGGRLSLKTLPTVCPDGGHTACGTLTCDACVGLATTQRTGWVPQGVLYARVVRRHADPQAFMGWNPWGAELQTLVQYWIFYLYDRWQTETVIGRVTQEHQGDWEFVAVGLTAQYRPLFVALSAHCAGQVVDWNESLPAAPGHLVAGRIVISDHRVAPTDEVSHPIVAVARGSHANYARSSDRRPPDWGSCSSLPSGALAAFSYASNIRDVTEQGDGGWFAYPRIVSVVQSANGRLGRPFSYPGSWGSGEFITLGHLNRKHSGDGPKSPPLQGPSWEHPIQFFFCGSHWQGHHGTPAQCATG